MLDRIANILQHECQLHTDKTIIVGVSGGPDSLYLLHALYHLGYPTIAVHVNHGLRPGADEESKRVEQFAISLGMDFISCRIGVREYAREVSASIEEAARILRYTTLFEQANKTNANAVVVGHNADDQIETILLHLLRGSGLAGLRGMEIYTLPNSWSKEIPLVRPLLTTWREEIQSYIDSYHLNPIFDSSNLDISFLRNRIRHELIPKLSEYNPAIRNVLLRMGESLKDDYSVLEKITVEAWESTLLKQENGSLVFRTAEFLQQPIAIQRHLLRRAIAIHHPGLRNVDFDCIERGLRVLEGSKQNSQTDLVAGMRLVKEGTKFWVASWQADFLGEDFPTLAQGETRILQKGSSIFINKEWKLNVEVINTPELANLLTDGNLDPFQAWLDESDLLFPLTVRVREPGDKIKALGLNGHSIKISDLMINQKLPKEARDRWPLICMGDEIIWVPGFRISELARVKPGTSQVIHLSLFRIRTPQLL
jgi:tRNA(Ile)-lysidine synthase